MKDKQQMYAFIEAQKTAFVASVDQDGFPTIKAMFAPRKIEGNRFYFTTNTSSQRAQQFLNNPKASIYFYNRGRFVYKGLMLVGTMQVLTDDEIKAEIWRTGDAMYYSQGPTDPDYCVFCFTATKARYYTDLKTVEFELED